MTAPREIPSGTLPGNPVLDHDAAASARLRDEVQALRERKQRCARAFGPAKKSGADLEPLKAEMQFITTQLDALEEALAALERAPTSPATDAKPSAVRPTSSEQQDAASVPNRRPSGPVTIEVTELFAAQPNDASHHHVAEWQAYVNGHPAATHYHDARWPVLMHEVFGHAHHALVARDARQALCGVLPLVRQRSRLFGDFLTSLPFVNYGGALADSTVIEEQLMDAAGDLAAKLGCRHVEFRDVAARAGRPVRAAKVSMRLPLPGAVEDLWRDIGTKLRAQVKRPEREGATTRIGGAELVDDFYAVFSRNMRDLGTPVYPRRWFSAICAHFADEAAIVVVDLGGKPVAAGFLLQHRTQVEIPWASTIREFNRYGVNMQLYWRCLSWAIERGATVFDFGRSSIDAGTHRFKAQWGAKELPLHWHYWLPEGQALPELNPQNRKFALAIAAWQRLPISVSRLIGPQIVKYLP